MSKQIQRALAEIPAPLTGDSSGSKWAHLCVLNWGKDYQVTIETTCQAKVRFPFPFPLAQKQDWECTFLSHCLRQEDPGQSSREGQSALTGCLSLWLFLIIVPVTLCSASSEFSSFLNIFSVLNVPRAESRNSEKPVITQMLTLTFTGTFQTPLEANLWVGYIQKSQATRLPQLNGRVFRKKIVFQGEWVWQEMIAKRLNLL